MKNKLFIGLLAGLSLMPSFAFDGNYFEAKSGIARGNDITLYAGVSNHPLYPYLAADFFKRRLDRDSEITALFKNHYSAPPVKSLHNKWIAKKYRQGDYNAVVRNYYYTGSDDADCAYRASQLFLGNREKALENIETVWMSPKSISSLCNPVFDEWSGAFDANNAYKRAKLAYEAGNANLAESMAMRMPFSDERRATLVRFANFLKYPEQMVSVSANSLTSSVLARELLPKALGKLVKKDSSRYAAFAMQFSQKLKNNKPYQEVMSRLTEYLVNRDDPQAQYTYSLMTAPDKKATDAFLRYLVGRRDWAGIRERISLGSNDDMALYWLGRALEFGGKDATAAYKKAAKTRSYYGFLAADKIKQPYRFNLQRTVPNAMLQSQLSKNTALVRAKLLRQYGDDVAARREILRVADKMPLTRKRQLAYWLSQNGFYFEAIYILGKAKDWNDINVRFPTPYNAAVNNANRYTGTDKTWIYAIIRQETSMNAKAVSRAKAKGLMQLIPSTARLMARSQGVSLYGDAIFDPMTNARLGAAYLSKMYEKFGNIALSSAAYNAGPGRVDSWLSRDTDDMAIWVENIPFNETRKYVKHILEYQQVYAKHLGIKAPPITQVLTGRY